MHKIIIFIIGVLIFGTYLYFESNSDRIEIDSIIVNSDLDNDSRVDNQDLLYGARQEVKNKTNYKSAYYSGGYPPKDEGVCSDVIWRAFKEMGVDLKMEIDNDVKNNLSLYPRIGGKQDKNIDFRRVPNLEVFFSRKALVLTTQIEPLNTDNLKKWQAGDIVTFGQPNQHIAIISDKRDKNGMPYLIHNYSDFPREDVWVWYADRAKFPITGHFRWKY